MITLLKNKDNKWSHFNPDMKIIWFQGRKCRVQSLAFAPDIKFLRWPNARISREK